MKKILSTLLCIGALIGLPGCDGCFKKSCDNNYYDENRRECHDEMQEDGSVKRVCSDGNIITVYEGEGVEGKKRKDRREVKHKVRMVDPNIPADTPIKPCAPGMPIWGEVAREEVEPQKRAPRGGRMSRRKEMMEMEEDMQ